MAQGSGSATMKKLSIWLALLCLLIQSQTNDAAVFTVGDSSGWSHNSGSWPTGKSFHSGDVLVFNYNPAFHNVVAVDAAGYNNCQVPGGSKVYSSGTDRITLGSGTSYFICSFGGHCDAGMKIAVTAN